MGRGEKEPGASSDFKLRLPPQRRVHCSHLYTLEDISVQCWKDALPHLVYAGQEGAEAAVFPAALLCGGHFSDHRRGLRLSVLFPKWQ